MTGATLATARQAALNSALPSCFAAGATSDAHVDGEWLLRPWSEPPPYRLPHALWKHIGPNIGTGSNRHHGLCDDVEPKVWDGSGPLGFGAQGLRLTAHNSFSKGINTSFPRSVRPGYDWQPHRCSLVAFDRTSVCAWLGSRSVLVVGDSTASQFFLSLVLLLKVSDAKLPSVFGHDAASNKGVAMDTTATACDGRVRISFVRSDLLLWSGRSASGRGSSSAAASSLRKCGEYSNMGVLHADFARRSLLADFVVLGTGLHASSMMVPPPLKPTVAGLHAAPTTSDARRTAFFVRNLRHTLSRMTAQRERSGFRPSSVTLLGAPIPLPGCSRHTRPLSLADALQIIADDNASSLNTHASSWRRLPALNQHAARLARQSGIGHVEIGPLSMQRPEAAMARYTGHAGDPELEDCLHSCQPGPVDTTVTLWWNLLRANAIRDDGRGDGHPREGVRDGAVTPRVAPKDGFSSIAGATGYVTGYGFSSIAAETWLSQRGAAAVLERCDSASLTYLPSSAEREKAATQCEDILRGGVLNASWWPFTEAACGHEAGGGQAGRGVRHGLARDADTTHTAVKLTL